jgi:hypothetical protein
MRLKSIRIAPTLFVVDEGARAPFIVSLLVSPFLVMPISMGGLC